MESRSGRCGLLRASSPNHAAKKAPEDPPAALPPKRPPREATRGSAPVSRSLRCVRARDKASCLPQDPELTKHPLGLSGLSRAVESISIDGPFSWLITYSAPSTPKAIPPAWAMTSVPSKAMTSDSLEKLPFSSGNIQVMWPIQRPAAATNKEPESGPRSGPRTAATGPRRSSKKATLSTVAPMNCCSIWNV